jgi:hypothetical protein
MKNKRKEALPKSFFFEFNGVSIKKDLAFGLLETITGKTSFMANAGEKQDSGSVSFKVVEKTTKIPLNDFIEIWQLIKKLDYSKYVKLEENAEPVCGEPGFSETLKITQEGKVLAEFGSGNSILREELSAPLNEIRSLIMEKISLALKKN